MSINVWLKLKIVPDSESLVLTEFKNNYFTKRGGTKKIHDKIRAATPVHNDRLLKFFSNEEFTKNLNKAEICWKLEELKWILLNNSEVSSYLLEHILLFWKVNMQAFQKKLQTFNKLLIAMMIWKDLTWDLTNG
jgi:hypothetical protein